MKIRYVNGRRLGRALLAGARRVVESADRLNAINVFPVPDGDTGTNMAATVQGMTLALPLSAPLGTTARLAADGALEGARGNSGAIVAQFFHGLAEEIGSEARIHTKAFAAAARKAVEKTYRAVAKPREGTILTVLRAFAERIHAKAEVQEDFVPLLSEGLEAARDALAETQELLPEAKKAGVVDAGAQGFVHFLEGIMQFLREGKIRESDKRDSASILPLELPELSSETLLSGELSFRYCTETRIEGSGLDAEAIRGLLADQGDSLIVAGGENLVRVHIHTDDPPAVFRLLASSGRLVSQKVDDMLLQRKLVAEKHRALLLVDSTCDLPDELRLELGIERVPVRLEFDGKAYLDRDGLGASEFFAFMEAKPEAPASTSQPSPADFQRKLSFLLGRAEGVLYLGLARALSGTFDAGVRAAQALPEAARVLCLDSKAASIGLGLLARRVGEAFAGGASAEEGALLAESLLPKLRLRLAVPDLGNLIRSGRVSRLKGFAARSLGIRPILGLDNEGRVVKTGSYRGSERPSGVLFRELRRAFEGRADALPAADFAIAHVQARAEAEELARLIEGFGPRRSAYIMEASPALGLHAGLGALAIAWLEA